MNRTPRPSRCVTRKSGIGGLDIYPKPPMLARGSAESDFYSLGVAMAEDGEWTRWLSIAPRSNSVVEPNGFWRVGCRGLAQSGHEKPGHPCLLLGVERTSSLDIERSASDPEWTCA